MLGLNHQLNRRQETMVSIQGLRSSTIITTIKVHRLLLTIPHPKIIITCMPGFLIHSGILDSGSEDSSVYTTFIGLVSEIEEQ
jgi:hypothetical protein